MAVGNIGKPREGLAATRRRRLIAHEIGVTRAMVTSDELAAEFFGLFSRMYRLLDRRMALSGASLARAKVLLYLKSNGPARSTDIGEVLAVAPRTVTIALDALERVALVRRDSHATDRRAKLVSLTEKGAMTLEAVEALRRETTERIFAVLTTDERQALDAILPRLSSAVDREEG